MLMPCFQEGEAAVEALVLARIFAGYGELELSMVGCALGLRDDLDAPIRQLFKRMPAEARIKEARRLLLPFFERAGMGDALDQALQDLDWCRLIRNQYAHCNWGWNRERGLFFVNLEELALRAEPITQLIIGEHKVDVALLEEQESFFFYVKQCFWHFDTTRKAMGMPEGHPRRFVSPMPARRDRPVFYR